MIIGVILAALLIAWFVYYLTPKTSYPAGISDSPNTPHVYPKVTDAIYDDKTQILWVKWNNGEELHFKGSCTVWRTYPMMGGLSTSMESELCDLWSYIKEHGNPYPTAHLKKDGNKAHT